MADRIAKKKGKGNKRKIPLHFKFKFMNLSFHLTKEIVWQFYYFTHNGMQTIMQKYTVVRSEEMSCKKKIKIK